MKVFNLYYNIWNVNVNFITLVDVTNIEERVKNFSIYIYPYIYISGISFLMKITNWTLIM